MMKCLCPIFFCFIATYFWWMQFTYW
jgi:hypothetical protein